MVDSLYSLRAKGVSWWPWGQKVCDSEGREKGQLKLIVKGSRRVGREGLEYMEYVEYMKSIEYIEYVENIYIYIYVEYTYI